MKLAVAEKNETQNYFLSPRGAHLIDSKSAFNSEFPSRTLYSLVSVVDVVPAASPDPLSLEVGGPLRDGAAARVELAVAAAARDAVDHAGRGH